MTKKFSAKHVKVVAFSSSQETLRATRSDRAGPGNLPMTLSITAEFKAAKNAEKMDSNFSRVGGPLAGQKPPKVPRV